MLQHQVTTADRRGKGGLETVHGSAFPSQRPGLLRIPGSTYFVHVCGKHGGLMGNVNQATVSFPSSLWLRFVTTEV